MRLRRRLGAWRAAGASREVLSWIREGARCDWIEGPPPSFDHGVSLARPGDLPAAQSAFLEAEIRRCFGTGAWEAAPTDERSHISRVHLVPKKVPPGHPPKWRVVVNLRPTNACCRERGCRYESLAQLQRLANPGDWMISFDLQDGYHQVGIHPEHRRYMTFALPPPPDDPTGPPRYVRCAALPFGWTSSPRVFTKVMRVMVRLLRTPLAPSGADLRQAGAAQRRLVMRVRRRGARDPGDVGMRMLAYVDDFLVVARSRSLALRCRARVEAVLRLLGVQRNPTKGWWEPTQRLEHLGLEVDTAAGLFRIPPRKLLELEGQATRLRRQVMMTGRVPVRQLASFVGFAQSVQLACPPARFYLRALHDDLAARRSWQDSVRLSRQSLTDLQWWRQISAADVARAIWLAPEQAALHTDASHLGWGGLLNDSVPAAGIWTGRSRGSHINVLELLAVHRSLDAFLDKVSGKSVLLWCDNMTVVHILTNRTSRSPVLMQLLRRLWFLIDAAGISLTVRYVSTHDNNAADALSRGSPFDELVLRPSAWTALERRFGPHTIDRYASASNACLPRFNTASPGGGGEGALALSQRWEGENNFAFPPPAELPRLAQLLYTHPTVEATIVAPYWPAMPWFQLLSEIASRVELVSAAATARFPPALHGSAQHVLTGAMLAFFRVEARPATSTLRQ